MWPFSKRISLADSGIFKGFADCHSHILPGVDDGVQTTEEAIEILHLYETLGVRTVWLTPHIMEDIPNGTAFLRQRFSELKAAYGGPIALHLAAENMLDNLFEERLERNDLLPLGQKRDHLLVETSYFSPPMGLHDILLRIKAKGYHPVLAHPERYVYMDNTHYKQLKGLGVRFQVNLLSFTGLYGPEAQKRAEFLLKEKFVNFYGTDIHRLQTFSQTIAESRLKQSAAIHSIPDSNLI